MVDLDHNEKPVDFRNLFVQRFEGPDLGAEETRAYGHNLLHRRLVIDFLARDIPLAVEFGLRAQGLEFFLKI